jgi:hypothetical protein
MDNIATLNAETFISNLDAALKLEFCEWLTTIPTDVASYQEEFLKRIRHRRLHFRKIKMDQSGVCKHCLKRYAKLRAHKCTSCEVCGISDDVAGIRLHRKNVHGITSPLRKCGFCLRWLPSNDLKNHQELCKLPN